MSVADLFCGKVGEVGMIMIDIGMHMPDNCDECRFNTEYGFCKAMPDTFCGNTDNMKRPKWCPLKEQEAMNVDAFVQWCIDSHIMGDATVGGIKHWVEKYKEYKEIKEVD